MLPISVIIPTYNRENLVPRAVNSVLRQTSSCSEIIIIDDGSKDNTLDILKKIFSSSSVDHTILFQENRGPGAARNLGIKKARFPYIAFLDSDDHWIKEKLELQYLSMQASKDVLISHTREKWLRGGVHLNQKKIHIPRNGNIFGHCLKLCAVGMSTVMLRSELFEHIGLFDESLRCCEDYDLWLRASSRFEFTLVDMPLTIKEGGREDQVSNVYRLGMDKMRLYSLEKILQTTVLTIEQYWLALQEFERKSIIYGNGCIKHGKIEIGEKVLQKSAKLKQEAYNKYPIFKEMIR